MTTKLFCFSLLFTIQITICFGQRDFSLSKKEMKEDFKYLELCIDSLNPHLSIFSQLMGYNVQEKLKEYKRSIDTVSSLTNFFITIKKGLNLVQEDHARLLGGKESKNPNQFFFDNYPNYFTKTSKKIFISILDNLLPFDDIVHYRMLSCSIKLRYINGKYYNVFPVSVCNGSDTTKIQVGYELTRINGIPCDSFLYKHLDDYLSGRHSYDIYLKKFYNEMITANLSFLTSNDDLILTFKENDSASEFSVKYTGKGIMKVFEASLKLGVIQAKKCPKVLLIGDILYLRIPEMNLSSKYFFLEKIREFRKKNISKVVLDVRDNRGGSDLLWHSILSEIIDTKLDINFKLGFRNTQLFQPYLSESINSYPVYYDSILKVSYRLLTENGKSGFTIVPSDSSILFSGKIFVLHNRNTFSAANSLVTLANCDDRLIAVGESNGKLGGYGIDPKLFQLPNSKLIFLMHSTIHIPENPKSVEDYFWNKTEIKVETNPYFENIMEEYQSKDIYTEDFLLNKDIYFKKVLNYSLESNVSSKK